MPRRRAMQRKGVMYTLVAVLLLMIIGGIFFTQARRTGHETAGASADRVRSINSFIHSVEKDSQRAAYIAGFRSFIAMEQHVTSTGAFLAEPEETFRGAFLNGTIDGVDYTIMQNSSFDEYVGRVRSRAREQGISLNATVSDVSLWQTDPWNVLVNYTLTLNVSDARGTARWDIERTFMGKVPITDLRDPLFTAKTYGRVQRVIKRSNISALVNDAGNANDTIGFMSLYNASFYIGGSGPTILMRFAGNLSDSEFGIESLIDTEEFVAQGLAVNATSSVVDYLYFAAVGADACDIQNIPAKIKLDDNHLETYQVQGKLTYNVCP